MCKRLKIERESYKTSNGKVVHLVIAVKSCNDGVAHKLDVRGQMTLISDVDVIVILLSYAYSKSGL